MDSATEDVGREGGRSDRDAEGVGVEGGQPASTAQHICREMQQARTWADRHACTETAAQAMAGSEDGDWPPFMDPFIPFMPPFMDRAMDATNGMACNGPAMNGPAVNGPAVNGPAVQSSTKPTAYASRQADRHAGPRYILWSNGWDDMDQTGSPSAVNGWHPPVKHAGSPSAVNGGSAPVDHAQEQIYSPALQRLGATATNEGGKLEVAFGAPPGSPGSERPMPQWLSKRRSSPQGVGGAGVLGALPADGGHPPSAQTTARRLSTLTAHVPEAILAQRGRGRYLEYRVKWQGFGGSRSATWELASELAELRGFGQALACFEACPPPSKHEARHEMTDRARDG